GPRPDPCESMRQGLPLVVNLGGLGAHGRRGWKDAATRCAKQRRPGRSGRDVRPRSNARRFLGDSTPFEDKRRDVERRLERMPTADRSVVGWRGPEVTLTRRLDRGPSRALPTLSPRRGRVGRPSAEAATRQAGIEFPGDRGFSAAAIAPSAPGTRLLVGAL